MMYSTLFDHSLSLLPKSLDQKNVTTDMQFLQTTTTTVQSDTTVPVSSHRATKLTANELREKLLREKIKASRKASADDQEMGDGNH